MTHKTSEQNAVLTRDPIELPAFDKESSCWHAVIETPTGRALTIKSGQSHVQKYMDELLGLFLDGKVDLSFIITHRLKLEDGPRAYEEFRNNKDEYIKVVMSPGA